jgi:hypothetical protein
MAKFESRHLDRADPLLQPENRRSLLKGWSYLLRISLQAARHRREES